MWSQIAAVIFCFSVHSDFVKIKVNPQRAKGIHRAARCIAFADRQKHRIIAFVRCPQNP